MKISTLLSIIILICPLFDEMTCWDNTEMQMFDLVEEVNENFYEYLGVYQNATNSDIRRAYRKLSLRYHPDRNPNSEDALKFRLLVAIYEILKDDGMREKYNEVLKFGLPDWKMPSYYFRKLRKMSFIESFLLFFILATAIHYACMWGVYFEQKLNMEDYLSRRRRKRNNESEMTKQLNVGYKPQWRDILPLVIVRFVHNFVVSAPSNVKGTYVYLKKEIVAAVDKQYEQKRKDKEREDEKRIIEEMKKQKKERKQILTKEMKEKQKIYETGKLNAMTLPPEIFNDIPVVNCHEKVDLSLGPWTDNDTVALIKALTKFPAGVTDRWIKISEFVKRPLNEVTKKVKEIQVSSKEGKVPVNHSIQNSLGDGVEEQFEVQQSVNGISASPIQDNHQSDSESDDQSISKSSAQKKKERKKSSKLTSVPITKIDNLTHNILCLGDNQNENVDGSEVQLRKNTRTKAKYLESTENVDPHSWNQIEQKQLEDALRTFPKGTVDRWDKIAQNIPTKSKVECIERIKKLSQAIQGKNVKSNI